MMRELTVVVDQDVRLSSTLIVRHFFCACGVERLNKKGGKREGEEKREGKKEEEGKRRETWYSIN